MVTSNARRRHPVQGLISQGFGPTSEPLDAPYGGYAHFNKGYDYAVPIGTAVQSVTGGTVVAAGPGEEGWGVRVWIQAPDGTIHNYGHLSAVSVKPGDIVQEGQIIAASGNSGKSTGPHLSYDVWQNTPSGPKYIDPSAYVGGDSSPARGSAMPGPTTPTTPANDPYRKALAEYSASLATQLKDYDTRIAALNTQLAGAKEPAEQYTLTQQLKLLTEARNDTHGRYLQALIAENPEKAETPSARAATQLASDRLVFDMMRTAFSDNITVQKMLYDLQDQNQKNLLAWYTAQNQRGQTQLNARESVVNAVNVKQAIELVRAVRVLEAAKFIQDGRKYMVERLLPPGTKYQPGFGPGDPMAQTLRGLGLNPTVIEARMVSPDFLDPEKQLAAANVNPAIPATPSDTEFGIPALRTTANQVAGLPELPKPTEMVAPPAGTTAVPDYAGIMEDIRRQLAGEPAATPMGAGAGSQAELQKWLEQHGVANAPTPVTGGIGPGENIAAAASHAPFTATRTPGIGVQPFPVTNTSTRAALPAPTTVASPDDDFFTIQTGAGPLRIPKAIRWRAPAPTPVR